MEARLWFYPQAGLANKQVIVMGSLQDQLLGMGLADEKTAKKNQKAKNKQARMARKNQIDVQANEAALAAEQARQEKVRRDRELNARRKAEAEQKAVTAQIKQLIDSNRIDRADCELDYHFTDGTAVKKIKVNAEMQRQLGSGRLAVVKLAERYDVVPFPVAEKIAARDAHYIVVLNEKSAADTVADDDPYAQFQIPDDLMW